MLFSLQPSHPFSLKLIIKRKQSTTVTNIPHYKSFMLLVLSRLFENRISPPHTAEVTHVNTCVSWARPCHCLLIWRLPLPCTTRTIVLHWATIRSTSSPCDFFTGNIHGWISFPRASSSVMSSLPPTRTPHTHSPPPHAWASCKDRSFDTSVVAPSEAKSIRGSSLQLS